MSKRIIVCTIVLAVLFSTVQLCIPTSSEPVEKAIGLDFLEKVAGINVGAYNLSSFQVKGNDLKFLFTSEEGSEIDVSMKVINGSLTWCIVYVQEGTPILTLQPSNSLDAAKNFIRRYKLLSEVTYCDEFISLLDRIGTLDRNQSVSSGNVVLRTTIRENRVSFKWNYQVNDIEAPGKKFSFTFQDGVLRGFVDNWDIKKIGGASIKISEQEAKNIALEVAEDYISELNATVTEIEATLILWNDADTGRGSANTLYPSWSIMLYFDKIYPGSITGYYVALWADTGKVYRANSQGYIGEIEHQMSWFQANLPMVIVVIVTLPAILATVTTVYKKRYSFHVKRQS